MRPTRVLVITFVFSVGLIDFHDCDEVQTDDDLKRFEKWFQDQGARCRCRFFRNKSNKFSAMADRQIADKESILMVPQSLLVNSTVVERTVITSNLKELSLTEDQILKHPDLLEQEVMHFMQIAVFVVYSVNVKDKRWLPYFNILLKQKCSVLWMWNEEELTKLQDDKLMKQALKLKEIVTMLTANVTPKLNSFGMFSGNNIDTVTLMNAVCAVQTNSYKVTSESGHPVRTLVPGLNMLTYRPNIGGIWWNKGGALRYRYVNATVEESEEIFINVNPTGDSVQTLLEYGLFVSKGSRFIVPLPEQNSRMRRRFIDMLNVKKRVKYSDRFTFKAAGLPHFRVQALSESEVDSLVREGSNPSRLSELKKIFKSPSLHVESKPLYSCKDEVVALNLLSVHLRDELSGKTTGIPEDEDILTRDIPERQRIAISFRLKFKTLVTNYLDITSARAIETKRECLSRKRDEL